MANVKKLLMLGTHLSERNVISCCQSSPMIASILKEVYVCNIILHASIIWPRTIEMIKMAYENDDTMIHWPCSKQLSGHIVNKNFKEWVHLYMILDILGSNQLKSYSHLKTITLRLLTKTNHKLSCLRSVSTWSTEFQVVLNIISLPGITI